MTTNELNIEAPLFTEPDNPLPSVTIDDLPPSWRSGTDKAGWTKLMPVQSKAMPYLMAGREIMVQARTGSGKTGAFLLPLMERINSVQKSCQALILTPTRELARQIVEEAEVLRGDREINVVAVYGGVRYKKQLTAFKEGAHIVVGTPGRILDHLLRRSLSLDELRLLVFDEADRMLSIGFYPDMKQIQHYLPKKVDTFMFSATFLPRVMRLAKEFMRKPDFLSLSRDNVHVADVQHVYYLTPAMEKDRCLVRIIEVENPDNAIIFCNTKDRVHYVAVVLRRFGYDADELSGDLNQNAREKVLKRITDGKLRFLVATDVAARGIDIPDLSHVIQYEPPEDQEAYIHRAGRTGRAGASGEAVTLVDYMQQMQLKKIAQKYKIRMEERPLPSEEDVAEVVSERMRALLLVNLRNRDKLRTERMERFIPLTRRLAEDEEGLHLLAMLLDDGYQQTLHNPPPQPQAAQTSQSSGQKKNNNNRRRSGRRRGGRR